MSYSKIHLLPLLAVALSISSLRASAQLPPEALKGAWHAQWITSADAPQRDAVVLHFRKVFDLAEVPQHFPVRVSADNRFILFLNQHEVGRGPAVSDLAHWKYESYDLAPLLHQGHNELAATVWNFGALSELAQISDSSLVYTRKPQDSPKFPSSRTLESCIMFPQQCQRQPEKSR